MAYCRSFRSGPRLRTVVLRIAFCLLLTAAAGCATRAPAGADPARVAAVIGEAARQVQRCYRTPAVVRGGRQIVTRLRVRYRDDGTLAAAPELLGQSGVTPFNQAAAPVMAAAAMRAVARCAPLRLPAELHAPGWSEFDLTFGPGAMG
jgi:hypothetical protein